MLLRIVSSETFCQGQISRVLVVRFILIFFIVLGAVVVIVQLGAALGFGLCLALDLKEVLGSAAARGLEQDDGEIPVAFLLRADDGGDALRHAGILRDHESLQGDSSFRK